MINDIQSDYEFGRGFARPRLSDLEEKLLQTRELLARLLAEFGESGGRDAPGHCHLIPGVWDSKNGDKSGEPCEWCATWNRAKENGLVPGVDT